MYGLLDSYKHIYMYVVEKHTRLSVYNLLSKLHLLWTFFRVSKYTVPSWPFSLLSFVSSFLFQSTFLQNTFGFFPLLQIHILALGTRWVTWSAHVWADFFALSLPVLWWLSGCSHFFPLLSWGGDWGSDRSGNHLGDKLQSAETQEVLFQMNLAHSLSLPLNGTLSGDKGPALFILLIPRTLPSIQLLSQCFLTWSTK